MPPPEPPDPQPGRHPPAAAFPSDLHAVESCVSESAYRVHPISKFFSWEADQVRVKKTSGAANNISQRTAPLLSPTSRGAPGGSCGQRFLPLWRTGKVTPSVEQDGRLAGPTRAG